MNDGPVTETVPNSDTAARVTGPSGWSPRVVDCGDNRAPSVDNFDLAFGAPRVGGRPPTRRFSRVPTPRAGVDHLSGLTDTVPVEG